MKSFSEMLQNFVNEDYDSLVLIAKQAIAAILPTCMQVDPENQGYMMLSSIILSAIGSDGKLSGKEKRFIKDCLGLNKEQIEQYIGLYDKRMEELVDRFADDISTEVGGNTITLVAAIAACDETISHEESAFILKLLR